MTKVSPLSSPTVPITTEAIAGALRNDILHGRFVGNAPLRQDEIAARFGVSKIPVREALQQLKAEGLVTFYPNRGAVVTALSAAEADEIYAMRIALETTALQRSLPHLTIADLVKAKISELGENIVIRRFTRYMVGEGVEDAPAAE